MVFFYPKTIEILTSKISGKIKVLKLFGSFRVVAGGYTQSGGLIHAIWDKVLKQIKKEKIIKKPNILILGLGAGSAAQVAHSLWPDAKITGIEIDPIMIKLAKKYFRIDSIPNLKIINQDAIGWVKEKADKRQDKFDLILIDLYVGEKPAPKSSDPTVLQAIRHLLKKDGLAIFNRLIKAGEKEDFKEFKNCLSEVFTTIKRIPSPANAIFAAYKE
jgi:spermidine synthase